MTEQEWLESTDPQPMLAFLRSKASNRKMGLFAVACCRRIWELLPHEAARRAVETAELFCDNLASSEELDAALVAVQSLSCA
jgi:hypothetical protein